MGEATQEFLPLAVWAFREKLGYLAAYRLVLIGAVWAERRAGRWYVRADATRQPRAAAADVSTMEGSSDD